MMPGSGASDGGMCKALGALGWGQGAQPSQPALSKCSFKLRLKAN